MKSFLKFCTDLKNSKKEAILEVYQTNYFKVETYVIKNSGNKDDAKDIFQEAFVSLWLKLKNEEKLQAQNKSDLNAYLFRIARNKWISQLRKQNNTFRLTNNLLKVEEIQDQDIVQTQFEEIRQNLLTKLGESCKTILSAYYYKKMSLKEIAEQLSMQPNSVKNQKYRCMQRLRDLMNIENSQNE